MEMRYICGVIVKNHFHPPWTKEKVSNLMKELNDYMQGSGTWKQHLNTTNKQDVRQFWNNVGVSSQTLREFAHLLFSVTPHSCCVERLFSLLGLVHTKTRNRMKTDMLKKLGSLSLDLCDKKKTKKGTNALTIPTKKEKKSK